MVTSFVKQGRYEYGISCNTEGVSYCYRNQLHKATNHRPRHMQQLVCCDRSLTFVSAEPSGGSDPASMYGSTLPEASKGFTGVRKFWNLLNGCTPASASPYL